VTGDLQRALGHNLRLQRQARNLSQESFAEVLGVHRTYLGAMERAERNLTLQTVERFAERLSVAPGRLLVAPDEPAEPESH
jgi:transcriptional regulator with XRE-family HTH domain